jgi:anti-repressor protein
MQALTKKGTITSLELVAEINLFRNEEGNRSEIQHKTLLSIIRDEFEEEISRQEILPSNYLNERGRNYEMFELTKTQATQVLVRESKFVRKAVVAKLERLDASQENKPMSTLDFLQVALNQMKQQEQRLDAVESKMLEIEAKTTTRPEYFTIMGFAILKNAKVGLSLAAQLGQKAKRICVQRGYQVDKVNDPRFGQVGCYPKDVLEEVFA